MSEETSESETQNESSSCDRYSYYIETWQHWADAKLRAHEQLDSYLLMFSDGALVRSLSPTTELFKPSEVAPKCLLVLAWVLFLVTIGATLWSFRESAKRCDEMVDIAYQTMVENDEEATEKHKEAIRPTRLLNGVSICSFVAALLFSLIYLTVIFFT